ncbi:MAG: 4-(cytidine 5'-diphospho)-2-C-methyl-D-erythritol kinase [Candidatus Obscuribacterales bacterium]|nr:4-(cytidine 5'-diphospho)-2-C-methyl-D-erythritol kinase [Steroidobacteraceae bacterium]
MGRHKRPCKSARRDRQLAIAVVENQVLGTAAFWPAPAKLNLCLHIVGRRPDGYHLLQSAIQFIDLCDELRFYRRPVGVIERVAGPEDVPAESDLVVRAARLLAAEAGSEHGSEHGVAIALTKRIPLQAGLGGGSSDAATVLVALNQLWDTRFELDRLVSIGLRLGADVPIFVKGQAAWVEGIGEQLTDCDYPERVYLVIKPQATVSTAEIFNAPELTRHTPVTTIRAFRAQGGRNDCTACVRGRYSEVGEALDWLTYYGDARLTGTGACVFAAFNDDAAAERAFAQLPSRWRGFVSHGLNRSPLMARLDAERNAV